MILREYQPSDLKEILELFYHTVHSVNAKDYTPQQLDAWTGGTASFEAWNTSLLEHKTFVAAEGGIIIGFGDIDKKGYLDRLYIHKDFQRRGIASTICDALESAVQVSLITTHASITARPFFEKRGYRVVKEQTVMRMGVSLTNYLMEKDCKLISKMSDSAPV